MPGWAAGLEAKDPLQQLHEIHATLLLLLLLAGLARLLTGALAAGTRAALRLGLGLGLGLRLRLRLGRLAGAGRLS